MGIFFEKYSHYAFKIKKTILKIILIYQIKKCYFAIPNYLFVSIQFYYTFYDLNSPTSPIHNRINE